MLRDEPVWWRGGRSLLFTSQVEGNSGEGAGGVFRELDLATGAWRTVGKTPTPGQVRIAGATDTEITYLVNDFAKGRGALVTLDLRSGSARVTREFEQTLSDAAVSPDGGRIAIAFMRPQGSAVQVLDLAKGTIQNVATIRPNARPQFVWFPDGRSLVMTGRIGAEDGLWKLSASDEQRQRIAFELPNVIDARSS